MKKHLIIILLSIATALSAAAKAGDRFEWCPNRTYNNYGVLLCEVVSEEDKTCRVVEIYPPDINTPINYIRTPGSSWAPQPEYNDYRITEICAHAFDNPVWGKELDIIRIFNIPVIGDYAFFGICTPFPTNMGDPTLTINFYSVEAIGEYAFANSEIYKISVHSIIPPSIHKNSFSDITYEKCMVYIPFGTWSAYHEHPIWGRFKNLKTDFDGSVDDAETYDVTYRISGNVITISGAPYGTVFHLFDMNGRCVDTIEYNSASNNTITTTTTGVYILNYNDKNHKIMIRP